MQDERPYFAVPRGSFHRCGQDTYRRGRLLRALPPLVSVPNTQLYASNKRAYTNPISSFHGDKVRYFPVSPRVRGYTLGLGAGQNTDTKIDLVSDFRR